MPSFFQDERAYADNAPRSNFVFMGYPLDPPLPRDDYRSVVNQIQEELPVRLWYFTDEVTTGEMMRKIWRAILRADLCVFDVTGGNPNVAFEMGLAVAMDKKCLAFLKEGGSDPLGNADLGYAEHKAYNSVSSLRLQLRDFCVQKSAGLRALKDIAQHMHNDSMGMTQDELEAKLREVVHTVFKHKKITKGKVRAILGSESLADKALGLLRTEILRMEGDRRTAIYLFADRWVVHDHEVGGD
jgi:hypothetical protein